MSGPASSPRLSLTGSRRRSRLTVDPVWRVIDADQYRRLWRALTEEAAAYGFVGFDMEWTTKTQLPDGGTEEQQTAERSAKSRPRRVVGPVATVQLSTYSCTIVVKWLHLHALCTGSLTHSIHDPYAAWSLTWPGYRRGQRCNPAALLQEIHDDVLRLIQDGSVFKVGVGIHGDEVKLHRDFPQVALRGAVDLAELADACLPDLIADRSSCAEGQEAALVRTDSLRSLKNLCAALTGRELGKDMAVVLSDWGGCHGALTPLQLDYAAEDAEASYDICVATLKGGGFMLDSGDADDAHARPWTTVKGLDCREVLSCCTTAPMTVVPRVAAEVSRELAARSADDALAVCALSGALAAAAEAGDEPRWCKGRERPYYDNINVFNPDMQLIFTVDKAKAEWYVTKKRLARVVEWRTSTGAIVHEAEKDAFDAISGEPEGLEMAAIQLSFAPDFARYNDAHIRRNMDYFKQPKENICVVCGGGGSLVRFAVVPLMYRRFFPSVYMSHNSYDLLLLCPRCFAASRMLYDRLRHRVADDFALPVTHLRGKEQEEYACAVDAMAERLADSSAVYEEAQRRRRVGANDAERDSEMHPRLRLRGMQDYLALMQHREVLDRIFSFAKALHYHFESIKAGSAGAPPEASAGSDWQDSGDSGGDAAAVPATPAGPAKRGRRRNRRTAAAHAAAVTVLPEERRAMMVEYVCTHAVRYPLCTGHSDAATGSCFDHQESVFGADGSGAASAAGVRLILSGRTEVSLADVPGGEDASGVPQGNSSRGVLTRYWLREHPELLALLPTVTRAEERLRQPTRDDAVVGNANDAGTEQSSPAPESVTEAEAWDAPYVDSHAFLVVRLLMEKYAGEPGCGKTAEHAVGQFIYRWRTGFVEGMQPKHLPRGWVPEDGILR